MQRMSSFNPYIFKAFYDWLIENHPASFGKR